MPMDCGVITVHAFVLAEFAASIYRQFYVWFINIYGTDSFFYSIVVMLLTYAVVYGGYYRVESRNFHKDMPLNINLHELISVLLTGLGAFTMGNISFV